MPAKGWTLKTLKKHLESRLDAQKEGVALALSAAATATLKAEAASDKRAEGANELRQAMMDQQKTFATKEFVDGEAKRLDTLQTMVITMASKSQGAGSLASVAGQVLAAAGIAVAIGLGVYGAFRH